MISTGVKTGKVEPPFKIQNNVLKGRTVPLRYRYTSVGQLLFDTLKNKPDFVGQVTPATGVEDTYGHILERAIKCALWLQKHGVAKGDIVVLCTNNHRDSIVPFFATLFLGAILNTWSTEVTSQLICHFIKLVKPKALFMPEKLVHVVSEMAKLEDCDPILVSFDESTRAIPYTKVLIGHDESTVNNFRCTNLDDPQETAVMLFSSGTTALPKAVQISHRGLMMQLVAQDVGFVLNGDTVLWYSTPAWITGVILTLKCVTSYSKKIIGSVFEERDFCETLEKYKVTYVFLGTSLANRFCQYGRLHDYDFSDLKVIAVSGATMKRESQDLLRESLPQASVLQMYGMTESGSSIAEQLPDSTSGSCGVVSANCEIKIVDPTTGTILGSNQTGELCCKLPSMMTGYYKNPEATRNAIDEDGFLRSGDLAYYNEKGELFIVDRLKELIKFRGHQVVPTLIEDLLLSHAAVAEAAVVGVPHALDDEHPFAFVTKVPNRDVSVEELIKLVGDNMQDSYKLRGGVKFVSKLLRTHTGKISRAELRTMAKGLTNC